MRLSFDRKSSPRRPASAVLIAVLMTFLQVQTFPRMLFCQPVKTARFWQRRAVAVVKVASWRRIVIHDSTGSKFDVERAHAQVLAVLATERTVATDLKIYVERFFPSVAGPIKPGGIFLVCMVHLKNSGAFPMTRGRVSFRAGWVPLPLPAFPIRW